MLAKLTSKNQLTLPKAVIESIGPVEYFEVEARDGQVVLTPVRLQRGDAVRARLAQLLIDERDVTDAIGWVRGRADEPGTAEPKAPLRAGKPSKA